ncbi:HutD family protein, partial [Pseudomonas sp.]|uniref:HutD/Ves family protein n=1 Tax=Pseudomonas sp. TaxID=306 RepID=UPI002607F633
MSQMHILRAADYPRMPWKNGAGSTLEIARDQGEGLEGFGWRLSIADIAESGGFSAFAGYQRVITVLEGAGMCLQVDGVASRPLLPFDPVAFAGDSRVECQLLAGAIRDFNLIYAP